MLDTGRRKTPAAPRACPRGPDDRPAANPRYGVPTCDIPRLHYPSEIDQETFEREFAAKSRPCIIHGLLDDWPAHADPGRAWRGSRWDQHMAGVTLDLSFEPKENRIMHFGDDEGEPGVMFNPGRVKIPAWAFLEVGRVRQYILEARRAVPDGKISMAQHPGLKQRLNRELTVQNTPFIPVDESFPAHFFAPINCRIRDLVPLALYLSSDTYALPLALQEDLAPLSPKLLPGWGSPDSSRVWISSGGGWRLPFPPWSEESVPQPLEDQSVYSCFHCDRMENLHSLLAGEKEVVLVPPAQRDVLKATRFSIQSQWLLAPLAPRGGASAYLGSTRVLSQAVMDFQSDQSPVFPLRPPGDNTKATKGAWPELVDFQVPVGRLRAGDTLYIPAYHWHWVATTAPPALGRAEDGPLAISVNFWWWPIHNDARMEEWSFLNEVRSWENRRAPAPEGEQPPDGASHSTAFRQLTWAKRVEASQSRPWPCRPQQDEFEVVD